ncbi:DNA methyltransferase [Morganella phage Mecenats66]|nr:DNA methyltransferase [Morganella phage Mecenats66]
MTDEKYQIIAADPPWQYSNTVSRASAESHYSTMTLEQMMKMKIADISAKDSVLCMWYTSASTFDAYRLCHAWGFKVRTPKLITWVKMNKLYKQHINSALASGRVKNCHDFMALMREQTRMGIGNYTRSNTEDMLIATRGKILPRLNKSLKQVLYAPIGEHSQKPAEAMEMITQVFGDLKRIELFSRSAHPGWDSWGNQADNGLSLDLLGDLS